MQVTALETVRATETAMATVTSPTAQATAQTRPHNSSR
jgi:hypothetical protein